VPTGCTLPPPRSTVRSPAPTLVFVGRLAPSKRPHHALRAFAEVRLRRPDAQLWVIGTGPLEASLRASAGPGVTFHGWVDEQRKADLLAQAHVLVCTSRREGWGMTVTEAASVGVPAVCYDVPGLRDSVAASGIGRLTPESPAALASEILSVLGAPAPAAVGPPTWDSTAAAILDTAGLVPAPT
jgi:glycosyltransferase involved in cell wall biosynthesis